MKATVQARALKQAAGILGGLPELQRYLQVPREDLERWMSGEQAPPQMVFLKIVDVILRD
jgi:hypothetical protein